MTYKIVSRYIKDLSFEIPNAKTYILLRKNLKGYKIKINITSKRVKGKIFEVDTDLKFEPKKGDTDKAYISIIYSALIEYEKEIEKKELEKIILVKIPSEIFPDLKKIITTLFEGSGFKDFNLGEVDFQKLFESQKKN